MVKSLLLILSFMLLNSAAQAQSPAVSPAGPELTVVKHGWAKERVNWEGNPFGGTVENFEDFRRRTIDERRLARARGSGNITEANKLERENRAEQVIKARPPAPPRYAFHYKVVLQNTSNKTIKTIDWDYVVVNGNTQETERLEFTNDEKIMPGKTKELNIMAWKPPARTVSIYALDKNERQGLDGQVVIVRIQYTDGSSWQLPQLSQGTTQ